MGLEKSRIEDREEAWSRKAAYEGYKCNRCGSSIPYDERDVYFETKQCGYCAHQSSKDD